MSNKWLIVCCENEISYKGFEKFKKIGVERGSLDLIISNQKMDYAISDFDNVTKEEFTLIQNQLDKKNLTILNRDKDYLDGECAIKKALEFNADSITFVCKPTKRIDMNISLIWLVQKYDIKVLNKSSLIFKIKKGDFLFQQSDFQDFKVISFYPISENKITLKNFKYNVTDLILSPNEIRAYSNEFNYGSDEEAFIRCDNDIICILGK